MQILNGWFTLDTLIIAILLFCIWMSLISGFNKLVATILHANRQPVIDSSVISYLDDLKGVLEDISATITDISLSINTPENPDVI